jgi:molecular chaperone DnaJ
VTRDYYEILGVSRDADDKQIKKAYHRLAHEYHPDKNPDDQRSEELFKEATRAYQVLSNPEQRRRYDRFGPSVFEGGGSGAAGFSNFGDVFSEIFGDFFSRRGKAREKGRDRTFTLPLDFRTAALGGERSIDVPRAERCSTCSGTGSKPGTSPQICHACGGTGEIRVQQGLLSASKKCTYCRGRGKIITHPCTPCNGGGYVDHQTALKVRVPPGSDQDTVLRYAGEGEPGKNGGQPGDLRVVLKVDPHPVFRREDADLHCEVPVTFVDAALGTQLEVPTLDGRVRMRLPAGTQSGHVFRLRGKGVPNGSGQRGDQHVLVTVETPTALTDEQRALIDKLRELDSTEHHPERAAFWELVERDKD